jgi:hypothetical protein
MQRLSDDLADLGRSLLRALLVAALIFQAVIGSAHLAFAAAATDGGPAPVICTIYGAAPLDAPGDAPADPDTPGTRACPVCASAHQGAGAFLPALASIPAPAAAPGANVAIANDQWPDGRQPQLVNTRAPPRA